jgi:hypothetical protein
MRCSLLTCASHSQSNEASLLFAARYFWHAPDKAKQAKQCIEKVRSAASMSVGVDLHCARVRVYFTGSEQEQAQH